MTESLPNGNPISAIPLALRQRDQWVLWRLESKPDKSDEQTKVPYSDLNRRAQSNNPRTWLSFDRALERWRTNPNGWAGIGYVFSKDDPFTGIDLDSCLDQSTGIVAPWADTELALLLPTYAEISPSGKGIKVFVETAHGHTLGSGKGGKDIGQVEVYSAGRWFAVTGQSFEDAPATIRVIEDVTIDQIIGREQARRAARRPALSERSVTTNGTYPALSLANLARLLDRLHDERWSAYDDWLRIGMVLHSWAEGDAHRLATAYALYDQYSKEKAPDLYGGTAEKWASFGKRNGDAPRVTIGTLMEWARQDRPADEPPHPADVIVDGRRVDRVTGEVLDASPIEYTTVPKLPIDVNDLLGMERKPVVWYAPSFLREGLGLLVGQPNVGKTPAAIQLAIAIATGEKWLNTVLCRRAKVLYLGMEYSPQELIPMFDISRMGQAIPRDWLLVKTIEDDFPTSAEAAVDELEWYLRVMEVRVIIIDVLTAFLPPEKFKQNVYRGDYSELKPYHRLALKHNAAILGVWHASKRESDPKIMYNGSTGMWAAAASRMAMYQDQEQRVRIAAFPRMGDRIDWALTQEKTNTGRRWVLADAAPEPVCSPTELQVFRFLKEHADKARSVSPATIAEMISLPANTVRSCLQRMFERNIVQRGVGNGYYIEDATPATDATDATVVTNVISVADATVLQQQNIAPASGDLGVLQPLQRFTSCDDSADASRSIFDVIPPSKQTFLRLYLRGNKDSDQERAQELCQEYGIDYEAAKLEANKS